MISLRAEYPPMTEYAMAPFYLGAPPERYVVEGNSPPVSFTDYHVALRAFLASAERDT